MTVVRIKCLEGYLGYKGKEVKDYCKNYILESLIACTKHQILFERSNKEQCNGRNMQLVWGSRETWRKRQLGIQGLDGMTLLQLIFMK
jgi:hypothetical protein